MKAAATACVYAMPEHAKSLTDWSTGPRRNRMIRSAVFASATSHLPGSTTISHGPRRIVMHERASAALTMQKFGESLRAKPHPSGMPRIRPEGWVAAPKTMATKAQNTDCHETSFCAETIGEAPAARSGWVSLRAIGKAWTGEKLLRTRTRNSSLEGHHDDPSMFERVGKEKQFHRKILATMGLFSPIDLARAASVSSACRPLSPMVTFHYF